MDRRSRDRNAHSHRRQPGKDASDNGREGLVASGSHADVWLFGEAREEYEALLDRTDETSRRSAAQLPRYFERFSNGQPLGEKMFKSLGRAKDGAGNTVQIHEFKSYQFRIYGVIKQYKGRKAYVGTACDPSKKQDKADPKKIKKAAEKSEEVG
ncbi:hypothetical protein [Phyllobacterium zundukense]|uniref:Uncharacterized protein n=1 Tax=Phyllobacterium zundukense TaxID=1867719 RepID=A0ACD4D6X2_9HYPH|nr:hypothetical protein [Phyllobacterium zundukense]UXN61562.1 hypothetical protein N8E88_16005 [Phyllobacterium zundukense]